MKGFRVWGLATSKIAAFILILLVFLYPIPYTLYPTYAADSTPSADIKTKLEELKRDIASRAAQIKQEVNRKLKDKAYAGVVQAKSETSITISTSSGPKMISVNQDTVFENKQSFSTNKKGTVSKNKRSMVTMNSVTQDDYIAALGDSDETGVLLARKILLLPAPPAGGPTQDSLLKTYLWGQVVSRSDNLVNIKDKGSKNIAASLPETPKVSLNDIVILTGSKNKEEEIFEADFVHVIPQSGMIRPKKTATPSAKIASPSAKPRMSF